MEAAVAALLGERHDRLGPATSHTAYTIRVHGVSVIQQAPGASPGAAPRQDFALAVSNGVPAGAPPDGDEEAVATTTGSMAFSR